MERLLKIRKILTENAESAMDGLEALYRKQVVGIWM